MSEQNTALSEIASSALTREGSGSAVTTDREMDLREAPAAAGNTAASPRAGSRTSLELVKWAVSFPAMMGMLLVGRVFYEGRGFNIDPDMWWHMKVGEDILRTHLWPTVDAYSWTATGTPWIAYEWLGEIPLAVAYK